MQITKKKSIFFPRKPFYILTTTKILGEGGVIGRKNQPLGSKNLTPPKEYQKGTEQQCLPFNH